METPGSPPPVETPDNAPREFDKLWNYGDPAATETRFRACLPDVQAGGDGALLAELLSQIARTHSLRAQMDDAHRILDEADSLLAAGDRVARARVLLERGRCWNSAGDAARAVPLFQAAYDEAIAARSDFHAVDALHMLGIAEPGEAGLARNFQAIALAEASPSARARRWLGALYNNVGWAAVDGGALDEAATWFEKCLAWDRAHGRDENRSLWSLAKTRRLQGRVDDALPVQEDLARRYEAAGEPDGFVFEEIGECLLLRGETLAAQPWFAKAHEHLASIGWLARSEPARLARIASLGRGELPAVEA